jgi:hypothetical protein
MGFGDFCPWRVQKCVTWRLAHKYHNFLNCRRVYKNVAQEMVCFEARSHLLVQRAADYPCKYHTQLPWHTACCLEESLVTIVNMNLVLILVNSILRSTRNREELFQWAAVWRSRVLRMCWTNSLRLSFPRIGTLCILLQTQTRYFFDIISGLPLLVRGCGRVSWREDRLCNKVWSHLYWHVHVDGELDPC